jgi:chemotaxis protein methyltransferase CheR
MRDLGLDSYSAYRDRLESDPAEWPILDECCHITISRFFRDRGIFELVRWHVLPDIAARAEREGRGIQVWSAGCASGEEAYTLRMLWDLEVASMSPSVSLSIIASDVDKAMLARAREGCFEPTTLRELPPALIEQAFDLVDSRYCIRPRYRDGIEFLDQDIRREMPSRLFDLILCRYVVFTYFAVPLQRRVLANMLKRLRPKGYLVIGTHEQLPDDGPGLVSLATGAQIHQKREA